MIDFTNRKVIPGRAYNGANGNKIAVEFNGDAYMLKFPPSAKGKTTDLSYTNSCISEHIASSIFNMPGIRAQETALGAYTVKGKEKLVCACKDFTASGKRLLDFCSIKNTVLDSDSNGSGTELAGVLDTIDKQRYVFPALLREHFWNMSIADALPGNFDRHNGNWGFLYDDARDQAEIAPVFACGSRLLPQASDEVMGKALANESELHARVFQFPTSALKLEGRKINYYDFLRHTENPDANEALKRIARRIDMKQIGAFIDQVPGISDLQKEFYKRYVGARNDLILRPALELVASEKREESGPKPTI